MMGAVVLISHPIQPCGQEQQGAAHASCARVATTSDVFPLMHCTPPMNYNYSCTYVLVRAYVYRR